VLHSSNHPDNAALSTLMGLVVVLVSAGASAWWTREVRLELSQLVELAGSLGLTSAQRPEVGYVPVRSVPVLDGSAGQASPAALSSAALFCAAGTAPVFVLGLAELKRHVGEGMGEPMECVMLRNRPAVDARLPHGFIGGAVVDVLEHSGAWARVRGAGSVEGWVPSQYLAAPG
jgi:hypothetical protein